MVITVKVWVRSQDKKHLGFFYYFSLSKYTSGRSGVIGYVGVHQGNYNLGYYSSEEKVIKVLDMIQDFIKARVNEDMVFQMPKDEEVKV